LTRFIGLGALVILFDVVQESKIPSLNNPGDEIESSSERCREKIKTGVLDEGCATNLESRVCLANVKAMEG